MHFTSVNITNEVKRNERDDDEGEGKEKDDKKERWWINILFQIFYFFYADALVLLLFVAWVYTFVQVFMTTFF